MKEGIIELEAASSVHASGLMPCFPSPFSMKVGVEDATCSASITIRVRTNTTIATLRQQVMWAQLTDWVAGGAVVFLRGSCSGKPPGKVVSISSAPRCEWLAGDLAGRVFRAQSKMGC